MLSSFRLLSQHSSATRSSTIQNGDTDSDKPEVRQTARYLTFRRQRLHIQHSSATRSSAHSKVTADTSAILDSFDSLSNTLQKLNRRIHASTRTIGSAVSPRHKSRAQLLHSCIHCRLRGVPLGDSMTISCLHSASSVAASMVLMCAVPPGNGRVRFHR